MRPQQLTFLACHTGEFEIVANLHFVSNENPCFQIVIQLEEAGPQSVSSLEVIVYSLRKSSLSILSESL